MEEGLHRLLYDYLLKTGMSDSLASYLNLGIVLVAALILAWFLDLIIWRVLRYISLRFARKSKTNFDNFLVINKVPRYVAHIIPLLILFEFIPFAFFHFDYAGQLALKLLQILFVVLTILIVKSLFTSTNDYLKTKPRFRDKPMDSYIQVFMIFAWFIGILTIFAIITDVLIGSFSRHLVQARPLFFSYLKILF